MKLKVKELKRRASLKLTVRNSQQSSYDYNDYCKKFLPNGHDPFKYELVVSKSN